MYCQRCSKRIEIKSIRGRKPKYCDGCREQIQDQFRRAMKDRREKDASTRK